MLRYQDERGTVKIKMFLHGVCVWYVFMYLYVVYGLSLYVWVMWYGLSLYGVCLSMYLWCLKRCMHVCVICLYKCVLYVYMCGCDVCGTVYVV